jgi:electron transfer flavoprotein alpha subunit
MDVAKKTEKEAEIIPCTVTEEMLTSGLEVISTEIIQRTKGIEEEDVLVVAGRGLKKQEDLEMLQELADVLGGQLATTRPLVEKGWNDVTKQIGLSGRTVKPKLIITCGVSGAVQFAAGMDGSECIVAINTDPEAPIFKIANYCITKDLYAVVPKLIEKIKAGKQ